MITFWIIAFVMVLVAGVIVLASVLLISVLTLRDELKKQKVTAELIDAEIKRQINEAVQPVWSHIQHAEQTALEKEEDERRAKTIKRAFPGAFGDQR